MNNQILLNIVGIATEEQAIKEASKINLNFEELEAFDKGEKFVDKFQKLTNEEQGRVIIKLVAYEILKNK